jgi:hypothetical protein
MLVPGKTDVHFEQIDGLYFALLIDSTFFDKVDPIALRRARGVLLR